MMFSERVRIEVVGDPLKVEVAFREKDNIQRAHMAQAMIWSLNNLQDQWKNLAPVGKGHPVDARYPSWRERVAGTYRRSIKVRAPMPFGSAWSYGTDNLIGEVYSDDLPVAQILESGSGIYRQGPRSLGGRRMIHPTKKRFLAIPADHMKIGGNRGRKGDEPPGARFVKAVRGQRAHSVGGVPGGPARSARILTAPQTREHFKLHARLAAQEIKAML